jgi:tetratricopeptide (TPR) repeat protein
LNFMIIRTIGMRQVKKLLIVLIAIHYSVISVSQQEVVSRRMPGSVPEQEYLYAFGEATKLFLFGNYAQAVNLYQECLRINPKSSAIHFQLSKVYRLVGEPDLATEHARLAVAVSPDNKWYLEELATNYQLAHKFDSAIIVYQRLLKNNEGDFNVVFLLAALYEQTGKYKDALDYLAKIEDRYGITKETAISKSRIYESMHEEKLAMEQLRKALVLSEYDYSIWGMMAELFRENGKPDSAYFYYKKIYPQYKADPLVVFSYAEFLMEQHEKEKAKVIMLEAMRGNDMDVMPKARYLMKVIQDEPLFEGMEPILDTIAHEFYSTYSFDLRAMSVFADVEIRLENYADAAMALKRIIDEDVQNYPAFEQLIYCVNASENTDSLLKYTRMAVVNFPERPLAYLFEGSALYQNKLYSQAIESLEKGVGLSSNENLSVEFYSLLAECNQRVNNYDKSEEYFKAALKIDSNNLGIRNNYAYYLAIRNKDLETAENMSKVTIKAEPNNSTYLDTYGWVLFQMGKIRSAKKYIALALQKGGQNNSEILLHYGDIMHELKRNEEAVAAWSKALNFADQGQKEELEKRIAKAGIRLQR